MTDSLKNGQKAKSSRMVIKRQDLSHVTKEQHANYKAQGVELLYDFGASTVKRHADDTVTKSGVTWNRESEFSAMQVARQIGIPVPRVHGELEKIISSCIGDHTRLIKMDYVDGRTLGSQWPSMTLAEKDEMCKQLKSLIDTMRRAEWTNGLIGSCDGKVSAVMERHGFIVREAFQSKEELNDRLLDVLESCPRPIRDACAKALRRDYRIVFTHGDLNPNNILVKDGNIVAILDWETAGWYPEHWEYVRFCLGCLASELPAFMDYFTHADDIFTDKYSNELVHAVAMYQWQL